MYQLDQNMKKKLPAALAGARTPEALAPSARIDRLREIVIAYCS